MSAPTQSEAAVFRDAVAVLREARKLLDRGWCQGALALDDKGSKIYEKSPAACRWCLLGAIGAASNWRHAPSKKAISMLRVSTEWEQPANWNDAPGRTQAEVLAAVDRAVELGEQELAKLEVGE